MININCPRCESPSKKPICLGYSLCHGDKFDRHKTPHERLIEYVCQECGMFWKQFEE